MNDFKKDEVRTNIQWGFECDNTQQFKFANYGWICPKCGRVYSPFTMMCPYCKDADSPMDNGITYTTTTTEEI